MKKLKNYILRIMAFLLVLLLSVLLAGKLLMPESNRYLTGYTAGGIWGEDEQTLDVIVLGDSNAAQAVSPMEWYGSAGFTGYNYSVGWLTVYNMYYRLERMFEEQSPKAVLICTGPCYTSPDDKTATDTALESIAEEKLPLLRFHDNWKRYGMTILAEGEDYTWRDINKGFTPLTSVAAYPKLDYMADDGSVQPLSFWAAMYLRRIVDLCRENNAEPIFLTIPAALGWNYARHKGLQDLADELGVTYYDLNLPENDPGIDWYTDSSDGGTHLNLLGAKKVSAWLGEKLAQTVTLPDHRGQEAYAKWDEDRTAYSESMETLLPEAQSNAEAELERIRQSS